MVSPYAVESVGGAAGVDECELWSCARGGLICVADAAGRLAIFGDVGLSGFVVIGGNASSADGVLVF